MSERTNAALPYIFFALLVFVSPLLRPVLPPDETRYLTVAWEMMVRGSYVVPTLNFAPYHHKPPLLFWLIDLAWAAFGVGRYQALVVVYAASALAIHLTRRLAIELLGEQPDLVRRVPWILVGGVGFIAYGGLVMFDLLLTSCVLGAVLATLRFTRGGGFSWMGVAGLCIGFGILAKGPVVLIFTLWPIVLYPLWRRVKDRAGPRRLAAGTGLALLVSLVPVALWIVPALVETDGAFANALIWQQTAGRISGNLEAAHGRPVWFFLPIAVLMLLPWALSPYLWWRRAFSYRGLAARSGEIWRANPSFRFLVLWFAAALLSFSLISGKQPHYLVPILPAVALLVSAALKAVPLAAIRRGAAIMLALVLLAQGIASATVFPRLDLSDVATLLQAKADRPLAIVGAYQGELGYLAHLRRPIEPLLPELANAWFAAHPDGLIISLDRHGAEGLPGPVLLRRPYREHEIATVHGLPE